MPFARASAFTSFLLASLVWLAPAAAAGAAYGVTVPPAAGANYSSASFRIWVPDGVADVRGAVVYTPGLNGDGRDFADRAFWQAAARSWHFALVGTSYSGGDYAHVGGGSGDALLKALEQAGSMSNHPELKNVALLPFGFSQGGGTSFNWPAWKPERVIAWAENKGAFSYPTNAAPAYPVPGLIILGSVGQQASQWNNNLRGAFDPGRANGALWALVMDWGKDHEEGRQDLIVAAYASALIKRRLPCASAKNGPVTLRALTEASGWLGDNGSWSTGAASVVAPYASYAGDKRKASWLPDAYTANVWRALTTEKPSIALSNVEEIVGAKATFTATAAGAATTAILDGDRMLAQGAASASVDLVSPGVVSALAVAKAMNGDVVGVSRVVNVAITPTVARPDADTCADAAASGGASGTAGAAAGSGGGGSAGSSAAGSAAAGAGGAPAPTAGAGAVAGQAGGAGGAAANAGAAGTSASGGHAGEGSRAGAGGRVAEGGADGGGSGSAASNSSGSGCAIGGEGIPSLAWLPALLWWGARRRSRRGA
jgi:hypothetical protein